MPFERRNGRAIITNKILKTFRQIKGWLGLALVLMVSGVVLFAVEMRLAPEQFSIASISTSGTNLTLIANIPPGMEQVTLEMHATLDTPWDEVGQANVPAGGGAVAIVIPRPAYAACFFRLRAALPPAKPQ